MITEPKSRVAGRQISPKPSERANAVERPHLWAALASWAVLFGPTYWDLSQTVWAYEEQTLAPMLLIGAAWILLLDLPRLTAIASRRDVAIGRAAITIALAQYVVGRSQSILLFEVGAQIPLLIGMLVYAGGTKNIRIAWTPLLLLAFTVPLPADFVASLTAPLKAAVSASATMVLHATGYPIARSGVVLTVGQYQLLVADACAGLSSILTLEALGLIYMRLVGHADRLRGLILAALLVPIAFFANTVRVIVLILVTYHLGDETGQGFVHNFAGLVLFVVATALMLLVDSILMILRRGGESQRNKI